MMRLAALAACLLVGCAGPALAKDFDREVLAELNRARANPLAFALEIDREASRGAYDDVERAFGDRGAVREAVEFLRKQRPLPPLSADDRLVAAALDHVKVQGPSGDIGHGPQGNLGRRMHQQGLRPGLSGETISYGQDTPADVVRQLVIDIGVRDRGHREVIFDDGFSLAGAACGRHAEWGSMCVIDFAGALPPTE